MKNARFYGRKSYTVAVVHGGPGAPGGMAPVARELFSLTGVLEPLQTKNSIDGQVEELADVLKKNADIPAVLIGHSWGATLSYMTAARYPALVKKLILIGTPPLEAKNRPDLTPIWLDRLSEAERVEFASLENFVWDGAEEDKSASMGRLFRLIARGDSYDQIPSKDEVLEYQLDMNVSIFRELDKLPMRVDIIELGKQIACPVVAIHGDFDPRPAEAVREPLSRVLKDFKFILLEKCGHEPWLEKYARDEFFKILRQEI
jgi:pimeloyl-ACP methyl ester carboxylesterase